MSSQPPRKPEERGPAHEEFEHSSSDGEENRLTNEPNTLRRSGAIRKISRVPTDTSAKQAKAKAQDSEGTSQESEKKAENQKDDGEAGLHEDGSKADWKGREGESGVLEGGEEDDDDDSWHTALDHLDNGGEVQDEQEVQDEGEVQEGGRSAGWGRYERMMAG